MQVGRTLQELTVGESASQRWQVTDATITAFAELTGDFNRVHIDDDFARQTPFKGRIAHGMLTAGFISSVLANHLPGPGTIYVSQTLEFLAPVRPGDEVEVMVDVREVRLADKRVVLATTARVGETVVARGEAVVLPPRRSLAAG
jgi:3-hydroxybutyryl-CoA dehydratase